MELQLNTFGHFVQANFIPYTSRLKTMISTSSHFRPPETSTLAITPVGSNGFPTCGSKISTETGGSRPGIPAKFSSSGSSLACSSRPEGTSSGKSNSDFRASRTPKIYCNHCNYSTSIVHPCISLATAAKAGRPGVEHRHRLGRGLSCHSPGSLARPALRCYLSFHTCSH